MSKKPKLVICRNCSTPIAKKAKICPSCGAKNKKPFYKRWWFILFIIVIAIGAVGSFNQYKEKKFDWNEIELYDRLPEPKSNMGKIWSNGTETLSIEIEKTSRGEYKEYVEACQSMGYHIEREEDGEWYHAFDEDGYELSLSYSDETMDIELEAPIEMAALNWPKSEIAGLLPLPKSSVGKVVADTAEGCLVYVGETSMEDYTAYADECSEKGFSVDYERGDTFYNAEDVNGNQLSLDYQGNRVMTIQISKPEEEEIEEPEVAETEPEVAETEPEAAEIEPEAAEAEPEVAESEATETEQEAAETEKAGASAELADGMRPEFKEAMDSYEAFYDEYCDFINSYNENPTDLKLIARYADMIGKLADMDEKFAAWESEDLNDAELKYYIEVNERVLQKLAEVGE